VELRQARLGCAWSRMRATTQLRGQAMALIASSLRRINSAALWGGPWVAWTLPDRRILIHS